MTGFFRNISRILKPDGSIFVTLCDQQGDNGRWDLERIAWDSNLAVTKVLSFCDSTITGYVPKRAYKDEEIHKNDCRTYVIRLRNSFELKASAIRRVIVEFYGSKYGGMQTSQIGTLEELFSIMNFELTNSLNLLSYRDHFTVEEVHTLLEEEGEIPLENSSTIYRGRFGKSPLYTPDKLVDSLKILSKIGTFYLIERSTKEEYQYVLTSQFCTAEKVQKLLGKENTGKLAASAFSVRYVREFGRPQEGAKVREALEELSYSGKFCFSAEGRQGGDVWISLNRNDHDNPNCTVEEICELLKESDGEIEFGQFRNKFGQKYGRSPFAGRVKLKGGGKLKDELVELSHSGKFRLEIRRGGLWIILPICTK